MLLVPTSDSHSMEKKKLKHQPQTAQPEFEIGRY
jgi:hypothetical protein